MALGRKVSKRMQVIGIYSRHEYAKTKHNYHPALLISNRTGVLASHSSDTSDDVVEAYAPLSDAPSRSEYGNSNKAKKSEKDINKLLLKEM